MSMKATIRAAVKAAFDALGDLVGPGSLVRKSGTPTRDVETGDTIYPETTYPIVQMAAGLQFTQKETDRDPTLLQTSKMIFQRSELPSGILPAAKDTAVDKDGREWEILKQVTEPSDSVVILSTRSAQ